MHVGELTLTNQGIAEIGATTGNGRLGEFVVRILGCWHMRMSLEPGGLRPCRRADKPRKACRGERCTALAR